MKKTVSIFLVIFVTCIFLMGKSSRVSGTIYFDNGKSINFSRIHWLGAKLKGLSCNIRRYDAGLCVEYNNTARLIPYTKLRSFHVKSYRLPPNPDIYGIIDVTAEIETITGKKIFCLYHQVSQFKYDFMDELTGEIKTNQTEFTIGRPEKLNIRKIVFNN